GARNSTKRGDRSNLQRSPAARSEWSQSWLNGRFAAGEFKRQMLATNVGADVRRLSSFARKGLESRRKAEPSPGPLPSDGRGRTCSSISSRYSHWYAAMVERRRGRLRRATLSGAPRAVPVLPRAR